MYIEVFIGFKALFLTFRVVKKKALFDDEKPRAGGEERDNRERRVRFLGTTRASLGALNSHGEPMGIPRLILTESHIWAKASAGQLPTALGSSTLAPVGN